MGEPIWMQHARKDIGVTEQPGDNENPRILKMHSYTSYGAKDDETPWCSAAMCTWIEECGIPSTKNAGSRSWLSWGVPIHDPIPGCVVVFGNPGTWTGHVALYVADDVDKKNVIVLGGNQGNRVCEARYPKNRILGFRWPTNVPLPAATPDDDPNLVRVNKNKLEIFLESVEQCAHQLTELAKMHGIYDTAKK